MHNCLRRDEATDRHRGTSADQCSQLVRTRPFASFDAAFIVEQLKVVATRDLRFHDTVGKRLALRNLAWGVRRGWMRPLSGSYRLVSRQLQGAHPDGGNQTRHQNTGESDDHG